MYWVRPGKALIRLANTCEDDKSMLISIDYKGQRFRDRVLLLRTLRNVVCRQIEFWDCINRLEELVDIASDPQLWVERISTVVTSGGDLTLTHVGDYLAGGLIHVVSESSEGLHFPNRELLLPELTNAVNLQIEFRNALEQLKRFVDVTFDPAAWISTTSTIVQGGMDLTMADVDDYLTGSG
jgi:hypothetical protein